MIKSLVMLFVFVASTVLIISPPINPIGHASQQQYVFAQENTIESSYDKTITNTTFFPQIHNYTSPPPGPVNSWIIESKNGAVVIDAQRQLSEGKKVLNEVQKGAAALLNGKPKYPYTLPNQPLVL